MEFVTYQILNKVTGDRYVGSSTQFSKRKLRHLNDLRNHKHHSIYLQRAFDKYGEHCFEFAILAKYSNAEDMKQNEQQLLDESNHLYNMSPCASGGDNITNHPLYDHICARQKIVYQTRLDNNGGIHPNAHIFGARFGESNHNWKGGISLHPCADCDEIVHQSQDRCGECNKKWLKIVRVGNGNPFYGKRHSEETKEKLRVKQLGIKPPNRRSVKIGGDVFPSCTDAAKFLNVTTSLILYRIKSAKYPEYEYYHEGSTTSRET